MTSIFWIVRDVTEMCKYSVFIAEFFMGLQVVFMGLYQLSRLHYCFTSSQLHSKKGYPKYAFFIMYSW